MESLFERIGGLSATRALTDEFYDVMEKDEKAIDLLNIHPKKLVYSRRNLYRFLTHWFGGPKLFADQYISADWLELRHRKLNLNENQKNQWLYCMHKAMSNLKYNNELQKEIMHLFEDMIETMQSKKIMHDNL